MVAAFLASRFAKPALAALAFAALLALAGVGYWRGAAAFERVVAAAATAARNERDAHWRAEIAASNLAAEQARLAQALAVSQIETRASETVAKLQSDLNELEKVNAALAGGDRCGLGRDRVRLLNGSR